MMTKAISETGWNFDNSYARLPQSFFTSLDLNPVHTPKLVILNKPLAVSLGLNAEELQSADGIEVLAGNRIPEGGMALAQAYAGHQFGQLNMLGDGRALLLGEQITPGDERVDIQLRVQAGPLIPAAETEEQH
jgi:serine/tyrosine/threonine adenylyltransferase